MKKYLFWFIVLLVLSACFHNVKPDDQAESTERAKPTVTLPNISIADELPVFAKQVNEVEIADSFNDVDPTWILGSIVNRKTGEVRSFDSFLKSKAKINTVTLSEVYFKNFVEDSLAAEAKWLDFLVGQVGKENKAEVSIIKAAKVNVVNTAVDKSALKEFTKNIPVEKRKDYAVIIGYSDYILYASLFRDSSVEGKAGGYGAQIGGKWYNKFENTNAYHRIVGVWAPLPLVFDAKADKPLDEITKEAIDSGAIYIERINKMLSIPK